MATKVEFAVQMRCQSCKNKIADQLSHFPDVRVLDIDLQSQRVIVELTPTADQTSIASKTSVHDIQSAIETNLGLTTVVKGLGDSVAAVTEITGDDGIIGVVRFAQQANSQCLVDAVIDGLRPHTDYSVNIHAYGDLSGERFQRLGSVYLPIADNFQTSGYPARGSLKTVVDNCELSACIGRALGISAKQSGTTGGGGGVVGAGIVARASSVGDNSKKVCACSGRTLWDERAIKQEDQSSQLMDPLNSDNQSIETLIFNSSDYHSFANTSNTDTTNADTDRPFDRILRQKWSEALAKPNVFRYRVDEHSLTSRALPGEYSMHAYLNEGRAVARRPPQLMASIRQPFDGQRFNFTRIGAEEYLFNVQSSDGQLSGAVIVNQSPIEYCNALLVPRLADCRPQVLTSDGLLLAASLVAMSGRRSLRAGFNSLGAMASVNHQHFHLYYYDHPMLIETLPISTDHRLIGWPIDTLCFETTDLCAESLARLVVRVQRLVDYCLAESIAHNLFVSRSDSVGADRTPGLRLYVWPREPVFGRKDDHVINAAFCEFTGFFMCKSRQMFADMTEESCVQLLAEVKTCCHRLQHLFVGTFGFQIIDGMLHRMTRISGNFDNSVNISAVILKSVAAMTESVPEFTIIEKTYELDTKDTVRLLLIRGGQTFMLWVGESGVRGGPQLADLSLAVGEHSTSV
ncbi:unnamed protein product, partial [Medioppia subpectinata]